MKKIKPIVRLRRLYAKGKLPHKWGVILVVAAFGVLGGMSLMQSRAATVPIAAEAEDGVQGGNAQKAQSTSASGGYAVAFGGGTGVGAANPCNGSAPPAHWNHVILLMFENEVASDVIGTSDAPYITGLSKKCATASGWHDGNYRVDGSNDGDYDSKPSYALLTSGLSPSKSGITTDDYGQTANVDNIFNRLKQLGKDARSYQSGPAGQCNKSNFEGAYHDALRYYQNLGAQSSDPTTYCNTHDMALSSLMSDINSGKLPAFSLLLPTNDQNMHNNSIASGDAYAKTLIDPILDSAQYKSGDTAIFFLWDEETPIPNVLMAPSIKPGTKLAVSGGNPISHFSFTRTTQEMLDVPQPFLGDSGQAPSLLNFFNGQ